METHGRGGELEIPTSGEGWGRGHIRIFVGHPTGIGLPRRGGVHMSHTTNKYRYGKEHIPGRTPFVRLQPQR